ncbi:MAG: hypothetical protein HN394_06845 [Rhodospirillaceae bacterium]|nr:hypothetical protein [Rhodospirillaceae bacterium]
MSGRYRVFLTLLFAGFMAVPDLWTNTALAATPKVGIAAAVNPSTTSSQPNSDDRVLVVGSEMLQNEKIITSEKGRTQLLFIDGSALTIGPNSSVVLDEFVYDPKTKVGNLAFSATKGLFRLVGGKISKTTPVTFKTPTAVIGIRGGIGIISIREAGKQASAKSGFTAGASNGNSSSTGVLRLAQAQPAPTAARVVVTAQLAFGEMTVKSGGVIRTVAIPGFQVTATNVQQAPSQPTRAQGSAESLSGLEGPGGDNAGGATEAPQNDDVAKTQIASMGSNIQPQTIVSAPPAGMLPPPPPGDLTATSDGGVFHPPPPPPLEVATITTTNDFTYGGRFLSNAPFTAFDFSTGRTTGVAERNSRGSDGKVASGFISTSGSFGGNNFNIPARTGTYSFGSDTAFNRFGPVSGFGFGANDESFFYVNLREANFNNNPSSVFAGVPFKGTFPTAGIAAHNLFSGFPGKTLIPMLPSSFGGNFSSVASPVLYSAYSPNLLTFPDDGRAVAIYSTIAISGVGANQRSAMVAYTGVYIDAGTYNSSDAGKVFLTGYSRGSVRLTSTGTPIRVDGGGGTTSRDSSGNAIFGQKGPNYFVISSDVTTTGSSTVFDAAGFAQTLENTSVPALTFFQENYTRPTSLPSGVGTSRTAQTLNGYSAGLISTKINGSISAYIMKTLNASPSNFFITTNPATNRVHAGLKTEDATSSNSALVLSFGNGTGASRARQAFIDDDIFGMRESTSTSPTVGGAASNARMAMVTSAFAKLSSGLTSGVSFCTCKHTKWGFISGEVRKDNFTERQRFHLVPWVAGRLSGSAVTSAMTGSATYSGHVAANVVNVSSAYVAFGNYGQTWDFSSRTGTATISGLDGNTYSGSMSQVMSSGGAEFTGPISSGNARSGSIQGAFMRGATNNAGEIGMQFHVVGSGYSAVGIGLAKQP